MSGKKTPMYTKYWQNLLWKWRQNGNDGLTIPFIIGAQKHFANSTPKQSIKELINDIINSKEFEVYIGYCMNIKELILGIRSDDKVNITGGHLLLENGEKSNFYVTKFVADLGTDLNEISETLTEKYQSIIDSGRYSINQQEWGAYTLDEVEFIQECIKTS